MAIGLARAAPTPLFASLPGMARSCDRTFNALAWAFGLIGLVLPIGILGFLRVEGTARLSWAFLTDAPAGFPLGSAGGVAPAILGSLALVAIGLAFALPLGVVGAIGLVEYADEDSQWVRGLRFSA